MSSPSDRSINTKPIFALFKRINLQIPLLLVLAGCGSGSDPSDDPVGQVPPENAAVIGASGGSVHLADGQGIVVEAGIFDQANVTVTQPDNLIVPLAQEEVSEGRGLRITINDISLLEDTDVHQGITLILDATQAMKAVGIFGFDNETYRAIRITVTNGVDTAKAYAKYAVDSTGRAVIWVNKKIVALGESAGKLTGTITVEAVITAINLQSCFSGDEIDKLYQVDGPDSFSESIELDRGKTPLVLIHGFQLGPEDCAQAHKTTWKEFIRFFYADPAVNSKFQLFSYYYDTRRAILNLSNRSDTTALFDNTIRTKLQFREIVVLAHSMGGLVARSALVHQGAGSYIKGLVTLGTPHHGTLVRHLDEIFGRGTSATPGGWFLLGEWEGAKQLDWDNFDGKVSFCEPTCNPFLNELNRTDIYADRYIGFGGTSVRYLDNPLRAALQTHGIPPENDMVVPTVSALFQSYSSDSYSPRLLRGNRLFEGINHVAIHDNPTVITEAKTAVLSFLQPPSVLYGVDLTSNLFTFNIADSTVRIVGPLGGRVFDVARAPGGDLYAENLGRLVRLDTATGAMATIGPMSISTNALAFRSDGTLFGATQFGTLVSIDTTTGATTSIGSFENGLGSVGDIAFAPDGTMFGVAYSVAGSTTVNFLVRVDPNTGRATSIGTIGYPTVFGLAFGNDGVLYGADSDSGTFLRIDPTTGRGTALTVTTLPSIAGLAS